MRTPFLIMLSCCYAFMQKNINAKLNILKIPNNDNISIVQPTLFINNSIKKNDTDGGISVTSPKNPPKFPTLTLQNIAFLLIEQ
jgi:hypothetical protein